MPEFSMMMSICIGHSPETEVEKIRKIDMILFLISQLPSFSTSAFVITQRFAQENPTPCLHDYFSLSK